MRVSPSLHRDLRPASRGHGAVREEVWPAAGPPAGGAVCGLPAGAWPGRGGPLPHAGTGQPGEGAPGVLRLRGQAPVRQVDRTDVYLSVCLCICLPDNLMSDWLTACVSLSD